MSEVSAARIRLPADSGPHLSVAADVQNLTRVAGPEVRSTTFASIRLRFVQGALYSIQLCLTEG
jgi:hypothetical protein